MATTPQQQAPELPTGWVYQPPEKKAEWIGFDRREREVGHPETGEVTLFRPSVFVREYASVLVKSFEAKTIQARGEEFSYAAVTFDAASLGVAGLKRDFSANVAQGPAMEILREGHQRQAPVILVIEQIRRAKTKDDNSVIDPFTPIYELRGADSPGGKGDPRVTADNTRTVVAAVAPAGAPQSLVFSHECVTDPTEWSVLRRNYDFSRTPPGWVKLAGGVMPSNSTPANGGNANIDVDALADAVAARLADQSSHPAGSRSSTRGRGQVEATAWYPRNSDKSINLGSYLLLKQRCEFTEALALTTSDGTAIDDSLIEHTWKVAEMLLWATDAVQARTLGGGRGADRTAGSHKEAARWVSTVIEHFPGHNYPGNGQPQDEMRTWIRRVVDTATSLFQRAAHNVAVDLGDASPAPAAATGQASAAGESAPTPVESSTPSGKPQMAGDDPALTARYRDLLTRIGMLEHAQAVQPLLAATFDGARMLADIPADAFEPVLARWEADPAEFIKTGEAASEREAQAA